MPSAQAPGRVLVVKFGSIGDVVMAIPGAAALHAQGFGVDWVASELVAPLLRLYSWIHVIPVDEPKLLRAGWSGRMAAAIALWRTLRARVRSHGRYALIATLYYDRRYEWLTRATPAVRRVKLSQADRRFALLPGRHHTDEYARILLNRPDGETPAQLAPVPVPAMPPSRLPVSDDRPVIVLVPAGARNVLRDDALRRWPVENYVVLAEALLTLGYQVVLAGGVDDRWASPHFTALARSGEDHFTDLIGRLSLVETLALLDAAVVTVTHDTGPLHLAGLTSTGIVTIFGPTDPHGRLPHRANAVALWGGEGFACRPCYDGRDYALCSHNGCMSQVTPEMVLDEVQRLVKARTDGRPLPPRVLAPPSAAFVEIRGTSV